MNYMTPSAWYVVGYLRSAPDVRSFVFPVVQNENVAVGRGYFAFDGLQWQFVEPDPRDEIVHITPLSIPGIEALQDALPLYGYELESGRAWFGDACTLAKALIDFACGDPSVNDVMRREILSFVDQVVHGEAVVAKRPVFLQGHAPIERKNLETVEEFNLTTKLTVIGVGGAGGNIVDHLIKRGTDNVKFVCANTDAQALDRSNAPVKIQLGEGGLGAGADPERGRLAALEAVDQIRGALEGSSMVFILAGMGGGTGTGGASVVAKVAREQGIATVAIVTAPFVFEGVKRVATANAGMAELEACVDSLIVISNQQLSNEIDPATPLDEALARLSEHAYTAVRGISDILHVPGLVNVDFEDVRTVMGEPGQARIGFGTASGPDRAVQAAQAAIAPWRASGDDLSAARAMLVMLAASRSTFKLSESRNAMKLLREHAAEDAHVIYGTSYDDRLEDQMRVTVIATGLHSQAAKRPAPMIVLHEQVESYSSLAVPSTWRPARSGTGEAAAARNGMDDIEIPAFLRRQAS